MGKRRRITNDFCFECQEPVRSLRRHYTRKHGGEPRLRTPSPPTASGTPDGDAQSPSPKRQRRSSTTGEDSTTTDVIPLLLEEHWTELEDAPDEGLLEPSTTPPPPGQAAQASPEISRRHQATQADGCPWNFGRVRRQVLQNIPCLTVVEPPPGARDERLSTSEREFATRLGAHEQRRLCDCQTCIGHAWELTQQQHPREPSFPSGIRFLTLPAIHVTSSSADQRRRLAAFYQEHPEQVAIACGCVVCTTHRNLARAWIHARQISSTAENLPPVAGGCHARVTNYR